MANLRVLDVKLICLSTNGGGPFPGFDPEIALMPPQPVVKVILKMCLEETFRPNIKNKIVDTFFSDALPLYMVYGQGIEMTSSRNREIKRNLMSFGARATELLRMRADLVFYCEPMKQMSYFTCQTCGTVMHSNNPVDFARHSVVNGGACNKAWLSIMENEHLRTINMRLQQRCDFLMGIIQNSYLNMWNAIQDIGKI